MTAQPRIAVLFVCLGNICRSPLAEGVFRAVVEERGEAANYVIDSAGTGGWHVGSAPDPRSIRIAAAHGIDISGQTCRQVADGDFERFDLIFGMDGSNVADLKSRASPRDRGRIHLLTDFAHGASKDVPDPYYGGPDGFLSVYRMIRAACESVADQLAARGAAGASKGQASSTT